MPQIHLNIDIAFVKKGTRKLRRLRADRCKARLCFHSSRRRIYRIQCSSGKSFSRLSRKLRVSDIIFKGKSWKSAFLGIFNDLIKIRYCGDLVRFYRNSTISSFCKGTFESLQVSRRFNGRVVPFYEHVCSNPRMIFV